MKKCENCKYFVENHCRWQTISDTKGFEKDASECWNYEKKRIVELFFGGKRGVDK